MLQYYEKNKLELGIDEAGRGCLFGPVCVAAVIWLQQDEETEKTYEIMDSKKCNLTQRLQLRNYIENNAIAYSVQMIDNVIIDKYNILQATMKGMHKCIDDITSQINIDHILIDGPHFNFYPGIPHTCVINGDNTYKSIASASILAKTYRDEYIENLVSNNNYLQIYDIQNNHGYGTKKHVNAIKTHGITQWHRRTFGICKSYMNN